MTKYLASAFLLVGTSVFFVACSNGSDRCSNRSRVYAGSVEISGHGDSNLEDLECVQVITGDLTISDQDVKSLEGLSVLEQVQGNLEITGSNDLSTLKGLEQLTEVGGTLSLGGLKALETLEGLSSLKTIGGDLSVVANDKLVNVQGLDSLSIIHGEFQLNDNPKLTSATLNEETLRMPEVGSVYIMANESLKTLKGFGVPPSGDEPCQYYTRHNGINIFGNVHLEEVELPHVRNVCVEISANPLLNTISARVPYDGYNVNMGLTGLPKLKALSLPGWVFYSFKIQDTGLETLDTLEGNVVSCNLEVIANPVLEDISTLDQGFGLIAGNFTFSQNPVLATCEIQAVKNQLPVTDRQCVNNDGVTQGARIVDIKGNDDNATCE